MNTVRPDSIIVRHGEFGKNSIQGQMMDGRAFRILLAGFDRKESDRIANEMAETLPALIKKALTENQ